MTILFPNVTKLFPNVTILFTKVVFKNSNIVKSESAEPPKSASVNLGKYRKYSFQFSAANKHLHFYYFATDWPYQENIAVFRNIYWNDLSSKLFLFGTFHLFESCIGQGVAAIHQVGNFGETLQRWNFNHEWHQRC